jgi:hypothetical protein
MLWQLVSDYVKQGVFQAGGTPVEFGVIGSSWHVKRRWSLFGMKGRRVAQVCGRWPEP